MTQLSSRTVTVSRRSLYLPELKLKSVVTKTKRRDTKEARKGLGMFSNTINSYSTICRLKLARDTSPG